MGEACAGCSNIREEPSAAVGEEPSAADAAAPPVAVDEERSGSDATTSAAADLLSFPVEDGQKGSQMTMVVNVQEI